MIQYSSSLFNCRRELFGSGVTIHSIEPSGFRTAIMGSIRKSYKRSYRNASLELKEFYGGTITDAGKISNW